MRRADASECLDVACKHSPSHELDTHDHGESNPAFRRDILSSWQRCQLAGTTTDSEHVPYDPQFDRPSRLMRAAEPVMDRLADQLSDTPGSILLADSMAQIIDRRSGTRELLHSLDKAYVAPGFYFSEESVGTNGVGTALEERRPFMVSGAEHFRGNLREFTCVGAPVIHPISGAIEGVLDVTCDVNEANVLMKPLVLSAIREIESRIYADASLRERALLENFLHISRRTNAAVVSLNQDFLIANSAASKLLDPSDQALLWEWASIGLSTRTEFDEDVRLAQGIAVHAHARRVHESGCLDGVLIEMRIQENALSRQAKPRPRTRQPRLTKRVDFPRGRSAAWERTREDIEALAATDLPVLLSGEPGTGKLFMARHIHEARFIEHESLTVLDGQIAVDDPEAWYERFRRQISVTGTLLLRHLDALPTSLCARIGAALDSDDHPNVRLMATAMDAFGLRGEVGRLLDHFPASIEIPALRRRPEDIADLAPAILRAHSMTGPVPCLQPITLQTLTARPWPGNVRELEAVLTTAAIRSMGSDITPANLPTAYRTPPSRYRLASLERAERETILQTLADTGGNKLHAARRLGIARSTLYRKMRILGLDSNRLGA